MVTNTSNTFKSYKLNSTADEVDTAIDKAKAIDSVVDISISKHNTDENAHQNISSSLEAKINATEASLNEKFTDYYTSEEADKSIDEKLTNYYTSTQTDELLESKVNTDQYASTTQAGIIKLAADMSGNNMSCIEVGADGSAKIKDGFGVKNALGKLQIVTATNEMIDAKANPYFPITPSNLDYAVNSVEIARIERLKYYGDPDIFPTDSSYFTFTANDDDTTATIEMNFDVDFDVTDLVIPYKCTINDKKYIVTNISEGTFSYCTSLASVTIPNGITTINYGAFQKCSSLTSVVIPSSVTSIGAGAFQRCSSLTSVVIPSSVTSIEGDAFSYCTSLASVTIPNGITTINYGAFQKCSSLTSVVIPSSVESIGNYTFDGCTNLTIICEQDSYAEEYAKLNNINYKYDIVDPSALAGIGDLSTLTTSANDTLVNAVNEIDLADERIKYYGDPDIVPTDAGYFKFTANDGTTATIARNTDVDFDVTNLVIPYKCTIDDKEYMVTNLSEGTFGYCTTLESVIIPSTITTIYYGAFQKCSSLTSVVIPSSVTNIGGDAFQECSSLTSVVIPSSVTNIWSGAFQKCSSLTSVVIPSSVTSIRDDAFSYCTSLASIVIPSSVESIGNHTFVGCTNLTITCEQGSYAETYAQENGINVKYDIIDPDAYAEKTTVEELQSTKSDKPTIINYIDAEEVPTSITLENNTVYQFDVISELSIAYPEEISDSFEALIYFSSNETNINFIYPDGSTLETKMSGQDCIDNAFAPVANKRYELSLKWDGKYMNGLVGAVSI